MTKEAICEIPYHRLTLEKAIYLLTECVDGHFDADKQVVMVEGDD